MPTRGKVQPHLDIISAGVNVGSDNGLIGYRRAAYIPCSSSLVTPPASDHWKWNGHLIIGSYGVDDDDSRVRAFDRRPGIPEDSTCHAVRNKDIEGRQ